MQNLVDGTLKAHAFFGTAGVPYLLKAALKSSGNVSLPLR